MARVKRVDNSRKPHVCGRGNHEIPKGESYLTASPGYRSKPKYRCLQHPFRPSELTTSLASEPMSAVEEFEDAAGHGFDTHDDLESAWADLVQAVEDYQSQRQDALDAWEHGNSQLEEYVETADAAASEVQSHTIETFDEDEPEEGTPEWDEWDERRAEHLSEQTEEALSVASGLEF